MLTIEGEARTSSLSCDWSRRTGEWGRCCVMTRRGGAMGIRRIALITAACIALLAAGTGLMLASGGRGAVVATVLVLPATVLGLGVSVFNLAKLQRDGHVVLSEAARSLARQVGEREA